MASYTCPVCGGTLTFAGEYCGCSNCQINQGYGNSQALAYIDFMSKVPKQVIEHNIANNMKSINSSLKLLENVLTGIKTSLNNINGTLGGIQSAISALGSKS